MTEERGIGTRDLAAGGLVVWIVLGLAGTLAGPGTTQQVTFAISALGLVTGGALLSVRQFRAGAATVATGFALLVLAESHALGLAAGGVAATASVGMSAALYVPGLLLVSIPSVLPGVARIAGVIATIPFAALAALYTTGMHVDPANPFAGAGYGLMSIAVVVWVYALYRPDNPSFL
ncbi:MAG TPA: hypothetical protein VIN34_08555 [Candidatus Limnocylindria bacterium]|jgi:hypothetical protein